MVTNLPAEAKDKWAEVVTCRSIPEKIKLMREFISLVPKHKGTSNLLANVRSRIANHERDLERKKSIRKSGGYGGFSIQKEGPGQAVILGLTNVGRSSLLSCLTNAKVKSTPVQFFTQQPIVGMMQYKDLQFQLVEAPALVEGSASGRMNGPQILGLARNADCLILILDLTDNPDKQLKIMQKELEESGIIIEKPLGEVRVEKRSLGTGIQIIGGGVLLDTTLKDVKRLFNSYKVYSAIVRIRGKVTLDNIEDALFSSSVYKPSIILVNKKDIEGVRKDLEKIEKIAAEMKLPILSISCKKNIGLESFGAELFKLFEIIRIYTKEPGLKEPSLIPFVVDEGTTVIKFAKEIHSVLYRKFRYARLWGKSVKYQGQRVGSNHRLMDGDIIEIH